MAENVLRNHIVQDVGEYLGYWSETSFFKINRLLGASWPIFYLNVLKLDNIFRTEFFNVEDKASILYSWTNGWTKLAEFFWGNP